MSARTRSHACRLAVAVVLSCGAVLPEVAAAQTLTDTVMVTLRVPLSLSNLHPSIGAVRVTCQISGGHVYAIPTARGEKQVSVSGGAVNTTVSVMVRTAVRIGTSTPVGTTSNYSCHAAADVNNYPYTLLTTATDPKYKVDTDAVTTGTITW